VSLVLYLDLFAGAGGDMLLAALLDLGFPLEDLRVALGRLHLRGCEVAAEKVTVRGIAGTRLLVASGSCGRPAERPAAARALIGASSLSARVQDRSIAVLERLARAEAQVHGVAVDDVHFHEIGGADTLVDIVGFAAGLEALGIDEVCSSPIPLGSGTVRTEHGLLPVPAPATAALLAEAGARTCAHPAKTEIVTPTAAAILAEFAVFRRPSLDLHGVGHGIGTREFPWPSAVRALLGETLPVARPQGAGCAGRTDPPPDHGHPGGG
jgi:pyridinium-3,5-bisthiocarboxylic acid mononucleotide nickel chelatase